MIRVCTKTPEDTLSLGERLGKALRPGSVVGLTGDLGTGKTTLAKGLGRGLQVPTTIQSPTYGLGHFHQGGRLPLWHADLYRIEAPEDLEQIGLEEALLEDGVVVIEWADRFPSVLPADYLQITLFERASGRHIELEATGPRHAALMVSIGV